MKIPILVLSSMLLIPLILVPSFNSGNTQDDQALAELLKEAELLAKETEDGIALENRELARSLIQLGLRKGEEIPEAVLIGVYILHRNPVQFVNNKTPEEESAWLENDEMELGNLVEQAVAMNPKEALLRAKPLSEFAEVVRNKLAEKDKGLRGGPKRWTVKIKKGAYFQLDPSLVYNSQEKAMITATSDSNTMLAIIVDRSDVQTEKKRAIGRGRVSANWNSGIHTTNWNVRIYNIKGSETATVRIETN